VITCEISKSEIRYNQAVKVGDKWVHYEYIKKINDIFKKRVDSFEELIEKINVVEKEKKSRITLLSIYWLLYQKKELDIKKLPKDIAIFSVKLFKKYPNCLNINEWIVIYDSLFKFYIEKYKKQYPEIEGGWRELPPNISDNFYSKDVIKRDWIINKKAHSSSKDLKEEEKRLNEIKRCIKEIWGE
jgi:Mg2+ and Co2+ transporter CorA